MEKLSYVLTQYFVSSVYVRFYFSLPLIFTLLAVLIELFYIGMPVVWTDGRSLGVRSRDYQIFWDGSGWVGMGRLPHFLSYGAPPMHARFTRGWSSAIKSTCSPALPSQLRRP